MLHFEHKRLLLMFHELQQVILNGVQAESPGRGHQIRNIITTEAVR